MLCLQEKKNECHTACTRKNNTNSMKLTNRQKKKKQKKTNGD